MAAAAKECASVLAGELARRIAERKGKTAVGAVSSTPVRMVWIATRVVVKLPSSVEQKETHAVRMVRTWDVLARIWHVKTMFALLKTEATDTHWA